MSNASGAAVAAAHYEAACALVAQGRDAEASQALDFAIAARPDFADAFCLGGYILERGGKPEAAIRFYQRALTLDPALAAGWSNLAKLLLKAGMFAPALEAIDAALRVQPTDADAWNTRAGALRALWRLEDAEAAARAALAHRPGFPEAALNLGTALFKLGRSAESLEAYRFAGGLRVDYADAICGEALALRALDRLDEARAAFDCAAALGCREAVSGRGCTDLMLGDFAAGWEGYEARWINGRSIAEALGVRYPLWAGPGAPPQRVLVIHDHGLGDAIQFARYLPLMAQAGAKPYLLAPAKLHGLLGPLIEGRAFEREPHSAGFDSQLAISSLPRAFATRLDNIPAAVPYLSAQPERVVRWRREIGAHGLKIGCVWQGNANPEADIHRAFPLAALAPLSALEGVRLISLQSGYGAEQLQYSAGVCVERLSPDYDTSAHAFLDAAAAMACLDLVVTCDTSIAHLAGALGRPVWVALKKDAEWRWMRDREDSPWYPTMRLFRQRIAGEWSSVFEKMAGELIAAKDVSGGAIERDATLRRKLG